MILVRNKKDKELYLYAEYDYKKIKKDRNLEFIRDKINAPKSLRTRAVSFKSIKSSIDIFEKLINKRKKDLKIAKSTLKWLNELRNGSKAETLSEVKRAREVLCKECGTHNYRIVEGYPRKEYGEIVVHKKECPRIKRLVNYKG